MEFAPLILLIALGLSIFALIKRSKRTKEIADLQEDALTFEDKMILLQKESNKRLKYIDTTLDWFFWIMVSSFLIYMIYAVSQSFI